MEYISSASTKVISSSAERLWHPGLDAVIVLNKFHRIGLSYSQWSGFAAYPALGWAFIGFFGQCYVGSQCRTVPRADPAAPTLFRQQIECDLNLHRTSHAKN